MSRLSGSFPKSAPGLPRGRTSLDPDDATAHQRTRLLRAVISAVAENGYQATTISDIVERARVSRSVMYREFDGKLDCFLAAIEAGRENVTASMAKARDQVADDTLAAVLRAIARAYLETCAREPDHTRAWVLELAAAGPGASRRATGTWTGSPTSCVRSTAPRERAGEAAGPLHRAGRRDHRVGRPGGAGRRGGGLPRLEDALTTTAMAMLR